MSVEVVRVPVDVEVETRHLLKCLSCPSGRFSFGHILDSPTAWGPWSCDDCGAEHKGDGDGYGLTGQRTTDAIVTLRRGDVVLKVRGLWFSNRTSAENADGAYFYNEHTCPTNYLGDVMEVSVNGDNDPHGLFEFVSKRRAVDDDNDGSHWRRLRV